MHYKNLTSFKVARTKHQHALAREKAKADDKCFVICGDRVDRYAAMSYIVSLTYEGLSLPEILDNTGCDWEHFPTAQEVMSWYGCHPDFHEAMKKAEAYRAEILVYRGLSAIVEAGEADAETGILDKNKVTHAKVANDAFVANAGFLNDKFTTKTKVQTEDVTDRLSEDQARKRLAELLNNNPGIKELLSRPEQKTLSCEKVVDAEVEANSNE